MIAATSFVLTLSIAMQTGVTVVEQVKPSGAARSDVTATAQIGNSSREQDAAAGQLAAPPRTTATAQVGTASRDIPPAQPTTRSSASSQLTSEKPNAEAPASGSSRAQSRDLSAEAVEGDDRCDPQSKTREETVCEKIIEERSAEFIPPDVQPLSPEQNLMIRQRTLPGSDVASTTGARRLANGEVDETNAGVAATTLVPRTPAPEEQHQDNPTTDAIVQSIIGRLGGVSTQ